MIQIPFEILQMENKHATRKLQNNEKVANSNKKVVDFNEISKSKV